MYRIHAYLFNIFSQSRPQMCSFTTHKQSDCASSRSLSTVTLRVTVRTVTVTVILNNQIPVIITE